jgi:hypothetical protein
MYEESKGVGRRNEKDRYRGMISCRVPFLWLPGNFDFHCGLTL